MKRILIVGGGYAGFYAAWKLEKKLRRSEAELTVVDPRPYMTYQPFLPEVVAGSIEARHAAVSLRRHLRRTAGVAGPATDIPHTDRRLPPPPAPRPPAHRPGPRPPQRNGDPHPRRDHPAAADPRRGRAGDRAQ